MYMVPDCNLEAPDSNLEAPDSNLEAPDSNLQAPRGLEKIPLALGPGPGPGARAPGSSLSCVTSCFPKLETKFCWGRTQNHGRKHVPYCGLEFRTTNGDTNRRCRNVRAENKDRDAVCVSDPDEYSNMNATPTVGLAFCGPELNPPLCDVLRL